MQQGLFELADRDGLSGAHAVKRLVADAAEGMTNTELLELRTCSTGSSASAAEVSAKQTSHSRRRLTGNGSHGSRRPMVRGPRGPGVGSDAPILRPQAGRPVPQLSLLS